MAGYMSKLQGYVYEGELVNGAATAVPNGILMLKGTSTDAGKFVLPAADTNTKFLCKEVTDVYGQTGYRFIVDTLAKPYYFVENGIDVNDSCEYDGSAYTVAVGELLRAHPLLPGEEFKTTAVTGTPVVGTVYGVKADGTIG